MSGEHSTEEVRRIEMTATVEIETSEAAPSDWLSRVTEADFPYRNMGGAPLTEDEGLEHLAYNALANGVEDASRLDGWGDLERGMVTMLVTRAEADA